MDCQRKIMPWIDRCVNFRQRLALLSARQFLAVLLPDQCRICRATSGSAGYCPDCAAALPRHDRQCLVCGVPVAIDGLCGRCQREPPHVSETIAPFRYVDPVRADIHQLKYHRKLACGRDLGTLLARELARRGAWLPDVLVPVPLHWKRQLVRGFNQCVEIAEPVSRAYGIQIDSGLVKRRVHTIPQVGLVPAQRRRNVRRVFQCRKGPVPESAAIIDDIITSGSTIAEVALCLRAAGVRHVVAWALARA